VMEKEKEAATKLLKEGKPQKAKLCLRKRKFQDQLLIKTEAQLVNLQEMVDTLEFAQIEQKVFQGLKSGNQVLKQIQSEMSIEAVEDLLLDTQEAIEYQEEVSKMISENLNEQDEEEILRELEQLEELERKKDDISFPKVPDHKVEAQIEPTSISETKTRPEREAQVAN